MSCSLQFCRDAVLSSDWTGAGLFGRARRVPHCFGVFIHVRLQREQRAVRVARWLARGRDRRRCCGASSATTDGCLAPTPLPRPPPVPSPSMHAPLSDCLQRQRRRERRWTDEFTVNWQYGRRKGRKEEEPREEEDVGEDEELRACGIPGFGEPQHVPQKSAGIRQRRRCSQVGR